jgi:hypothetical protein
MFQRQYGFPSSMFPAWSIAAQLLRSGGGLPSNVRNGGSQQSCIKAGARENTNLATGAMS